MVVPRVRTIAAIRATLEGEGVRVVGDEREGYGVLLRPRPEAPHPDGRSRVG